MMTFGSSTVSVQPIQAVTREVADSFDLGLAGISEIRAQTAALTSSVQSLLAATDLGSGDGRSPLACFVDSARLTAEAAETVAASLGDSRNVAVLAGIIENLRALRKRAVELRTISMLTKISCYRGTEDGLNIDSFVTALETWSRDLEDTVSEALSLVGAVEDQCAGARERLVHMANSYRSLVGKVEADRLRLAELEAAHRTHVAATRANNSALAKEVAGAVVRLVECLQFPDAFAQRAAHLETMLRALDEDRPARERAAIRRLAAAQLNALADALEGTAGDAGRALSAIAAAVDGNTASRWSKSPSTGWISALEQGSAAISATVSAARDQLDAALEILAGTTRHLEHAAKTLTASQVLNVQLTTLAHNTAIAASKSSSASSALRVLAGSVREVVDKVADLAAGLATRLKVLTQLSSTLEASGLVERIPELDAIRDRAGTDAKTAAEAFLSVEQAQAAIHGHADRISDATVSASGAFAEAGRRAAALRAVAAQIGPGPDLAPPPGAEPDLGWIFSLYTMEEERAVHRSLFPSDHAAEEALEDRETEDELDDFLL